MYQIIGKGEETMFAGKKIAFIGGGKMGSILVRGMIRRRIAPSKSITVTDIDQPRLKELATSLKVQVSRDNKKAVQEADIIVLAVKPQQAEVALAACQPLLARLPDAVLISIAAGTTIRSIFALSGGHRRIVRAMPNTPSLIGAGISGLYAPAGSDPGDRSLAAAILASTGQVVVVDHETLIDTVTAVSGSGPAYAIGHHWGARFHRRAEHKPKFRARLEWADTQIKRRGGPLLITARFSPGGRTALTLASGITAQPRPWFLRWTFVAAIIWATYAAGLARLVGEPFEDDHTKAFWIAFGTALGINVIIEVVRHFRAKRKWSKAAV